MINWRRTLGSFSPTLTKTKNKQNFKMKQCDKRWKMGEWEEIRWMKKWMARFQFIDFSPEFHWLVKVTATPSLATVLDHWLLPKFWASSIRYLSSERPFDNYLPWWQNQTPWPSLTINCFKDHRPSFIRYLSDWQVCRVFRNISSGFLCGLNFGGH
jgi:hypothetical protein